MSLAIRVAFFSRWQRYRCEQGARQRQAAGNGAALLLRRADQSVRNRLYAPQSAFVFLQSLSLKGGRCVDLDAPVSLKEIRDDMGKAGASVGPAELALQSGGDETQFRCAPSTPACIIICAPYSWYVVAL